MARPTKHAPTIVVATGVVAALGAVAGLVTHDPLWALGGLLPAVAYEVYRTEGETTRWASWVLLGVLLLEGALLVLGVDADLATFLGRDSQTVAGYDVPLGRITVVGPVVMAVACLILLARTRGRFTRALAGIILVGSAAALYIIDPVIMGEWLGGALDQL
ncbi:MAG: hypothetical protein QM302_06105 [Acidobacteriota bacterium]|nr:hypothetical protein [Acidobacteriota bacterium]